MPNELKDDVLRRLAQLGAQARLEQLEMERRAILAAFPDLARSGRARRPARGAQAPVPRTPAAATPRRRRRAGMTAAQRKEVSERMTKYWADRRKAKGKPEKAAAKPRRRRRTMNAAQRKEVSERMTRYWAARRKAKGKG